MNPYILMILVSSLGLGTMITFMSSHWLLAWMGLEINTLAIIPLMAQQHHPRSVEASTKYFLTQATAAAMILFASSMNAWLTGQWAINQLSHPLPVTLITTALALKIGLAPLHTWLPEVLQGLDLNTGLILSTWQKLAPFALLMQMPAQNPTIISTLAILSTLVGGWGGLNQTQLRKILAYSSIAHLGWMILILQHSPSLTLIALLTYMAMTFSAFNLFKINNSTSINMLAISWSKSPPLTALTPLIMLSLGGLPPLTGFGPKWMILQELTKQNLTPVATVMALSALLSLYFYLRLSYAMTLTISPNNISGTTPWRLQTPQSTLLLSIFSTCSLMLLPILPTILTLTN
uniref:NADH-ubiquinone oxidoreductase chain 2 n=1 Tax=Solegnathus hardwickii TaxID=161473 RepID=A0A342CFT4_9TELE|nr:NADH dehydrogenase subunit 2 [Solegnathus hardwickii]AHN95931.1 NADH dehydrogenase subunit 2 [Solegnathus hardwickii]QCB91423.1 NADH dehydrogenase subunit 2 [Solegnathus hardwickii]